jgi:hypothetical protein
MLLEDAQLNREDFDTRTGGLWKHEYFEAFACSGCGQLFVAIPDCHVLLVDADDLSQRIDFNVPGGTRCPQCGGVLQGQGQGQATRETTLDELRNSRWGWLLKQALAGGLSKREDR